MKPQTQQNDHQGINQSYTRTDSQGTLYIERLLPASVERVWTYLTEEKKTAQWLAVLKGDIKKGGVISLSFDHDSLTSGEKNPEKEDCADVTGRITEFELHTRFAYTWCMGDIESEVRFILIPRGDDTLLQLTHRNVNDRNLQISISAGWHTHLGILLDKLNGITPKSFWEIYSKLNKFYASTEAQ